MAIATAREAAEAVARDVAHGARLANVFAERIGGAVVLHYAYDLRGELHTLSAPADGTVPSLTAVTPGAAWYERETRDRFGVTFEGLDDTHALIDVEPAEHLRRAASSPQTSTVLYGPVRSGVVESARWLVETVGEEFVNVVPSMFFKRRALEERFVGVPLDLAPFVAEHVSGATASCHASAFCTAVERALEIEVPPRARGTRAALVELERIHQHLDALAKLADDGSLSVGSAQTFAAKERVHRVLAAATGNRFSRGTICVGGVRFDAMTPLREICERELDAVERHAQSAVDALLSTPSLFDRLIGTGRIPHERAVAYGAVGPVARGSGVPCDARARDGYPFAPLAGEEALEHGGDAAARAFVRRAEVARSFQLVRNSLDGAHAGPWSADGVRARTSEGVARVESPQGELIYAVRFDGERLARVAIRSASYANWPLFAPALPGNIFTDFSFIEHSFGALQAEVDR